MSAASGLNSRYDVIVVGARCAGAATALLLARMGVRVLVVERGQPGTDTLSTHALMRGGVMQLQRWGLLERILAAGAPAVRRTTFHYGRESVPVAIKPRHGIDALLAPRRTVLDRMLVEAAEESGAQVAFGTRLVDVTRSAAGRITGAVLERGGGEVRLAASVLVGADGLRSIVARLVGARPLRHGRHATAVIYGYVRGLDLDGYHWHFVEGSSAGAIPTNDGETCVFASMPAARFDREGRFDMPAMFDTIIAEAAPDLAPQLAAAAPPDKLRGFAGAAGVLRESAGSGWALVGDAACFRDPITAHGITDALRDAEVVARAIAAGTDAALQQSATLRAVMAAGIFDVTDRVASFGWTLPEVQALHRTLSEEMNREADWIATLSPLPGSDRAMRVVAGG